MDVQALIPPPKVDGALAGQLGKPETWAGLYHMIRSGSTTLHGFAQAIFDRAGHLLNGRRAEVLPIVSSEYPTPAKRPRNSELSQEAATATIVLVSRRGRQRSKR